MRKQRFNHITNVFQVKVAVGHKCCILHKTPDKTHRETKQNTAWMITSSKKQIDNIQY